MSTPAIAPSTAVPSTDPRGASEGSHSFRAALPLSIIFFFLIGFFSIYLLRDLVEYLASAWPTRRDDGGGGGPPHQRRGEGSRGLDPSVLDAFPIRRYSSLKGLREGECETECAVCLSEFSGDDPVRLLPACRHAFHRACIDLWLASHSTCPVCRSDLRKPPEKMAGGSSEEGQGSTTGAGVALQRRGDEPELP